MYGYIYLTTNLVNNKKYIGRHKSQFKDNSYYGSGKIIKEALKKYGKENFSVEILEECDTKEELFKKEKYWIQKFNATEDEQFYNIDYGGSGPNEVPIDVKLRLKEAFSGDKNPAKRPEVREKIRQSKLAEKNPMYGKHLSEETKEKLRIAHTGNNNYFYGKKHTEEAKRKMSLAKKGKPSLRKRKIILNGIEYESITQAMENLKISTKKLYKMLKEQEKGGDI